jgi:hypothetical protein
LLRELFPSQISECNDRNWADEPCPFNIHTHIIQPAKTILMNSSEGQCDGATGCPDISSNPVLGVPVRVFLQETNT